MVICMFVTAKNVSMNLKRESSRGGRRGERGGYLPDPNAFQICEHIVYCVAIFSTKLEEKLALN